MTDADVRVVYRKFDGSLHWHHGMRRLGEDEHGIWLGAPIGMVMRKGEDGPPVVCDFANVMLFPRDGWWTAAFNGPPRKVEIYADITTVPTWPDSGEVTMVDLDLDVIRWRADRGVAIVDQDEFAEHQVRYGYPPDVVAEAEKTAAWLRRVLSDGTEPFATAYRGWLDRI